MESDVQTPKLLWKIEELARATRLSRSFLYQQIAAGRLETVHLGRACRITQAAVDKFIRDLQAGEE